MMMYMGCWHQEASAATRFLGATMQMRSLYAARRQRYAEKETADEDFKEVWRERQDYDASGGGWFVKSERSLYVMQ